MKWFKHLTNASSDVKILLLEDQFGPLGYAAYWKTVEMIASDWSGYGEPVFQTTIAHHRKILRTQAPKLILLLSKMKDLNLLDFVLDGEKLSISMPALKKIRDASSEKKVSSRGVLREEKEFIVKRDKNQCSYCDKSLSHKSLNFDHFVPIALGGKSDRSNVVLSCSNCNSSKGMQHPDEIEKGGYVFSGRISKIRKMLSQELESEEELESELPQSLSEKPENRESGSDAATAGKKSGKHPRLMAIASNPVSNFEARFKTYEDPRRIEFMQTIAILAKAIPPIAGVFNRERFLVDAMMVFPTSEEFDDFAQGLIDSVKTARPKDVRAYASAIWREQVSRNRDNPPLELPNLDGIDGV